MDCVKNRSRTGEWCVRAGRRALSQHFRHGLNGRVYSWCGGSSPIRRERGVFHLSPSLSGTELIFVCRGGGVSGREA